MEINIDSVTLQGDMVVPEEARGMVLFSHGSGSSRHSPRNNHVARMLNHQGYATFLFDLLTEEEDRDYNMRFNIELLSKRLVNITRKVKTFSYAEDLPLGYFGASTGAASALNAAAQLPTLVKVVVSRGGRPDLAAYNLPRVHAAVLLIVGSLDTQVISLNQKAYNALNTVKKMEIVEGASHLFEEPGKLDEVAWLAGKWFSEFLLKDKDVAAE